MHRNYNRQKNRNSLIENHSGSGEEFLKSMLFGVGWEWPLVGMDQQFTQWYVGVIEKVYKRYPIKFIIL